MALKDAFLNVEKENPVGTSSNFEEENPETDFHKEAGIKLVFLNNKITIDNHKHMNIYLQDNNSNNCIIHKHMNIYLQLMSQVYHSPSSNNVH